MDYSTQKGRAILRRTHPPPEVAATKWDSILPPDFDFQWGSIWDNRRIRKESDLLWRICHKALAVNHWRGKISPTIDTSCPICKCNAAETIAHRFWDCPDTQRVWRYSCEFLSRIENDTSTDIIIDTSHAMFGAETGLAWATAQFWHKLRSNTLWQIWIERNRVIFQNESWSHERVIHLIWQGMVDYAVIEWKKLGSADRTRHTLEANRVEFDALWGSQNLLYDRVDGRIQWHRSNLILGVE